MRTGLIAVGQNKENLYDNPLLEPVRIGDIDLSHRVVLAPVTRCRALNYVPQEAHVEFYSLRATEGGLLISEAVAVCQEGIGFPHSPGIWNEDQTRAWKAVVDAVHKKGGKIFCQLWHVGRASHQYYQPPDQKPVSSTSRPLPETCQIRLPDGQNAPYAAPRALATAEIPKIVSQFRRAASNAKLAGFDGLEIHAGHGYLIDQFLKDGINDRSDAYGGSIANRCRLALEILDAVAAEMGGGHKTAMRISPIIDHLEATDSDPTALGHYLISELNVRGMAYLHMTEPRFNNKGATGLMSTEDDCGEFRRAFNGRMIRSGGYTRESGMESIRRDEADLISYGRLFISNPDLVLRFALAAPLNPYDRSTFYSHDQVKGYLDYPVLSKEEIIEAVGAVPHPSKGSVGIVMALLRRLTTALSEDEVEVEIGRRRSRLRLPRRLGRSCSSASWSYPSSPALALPSPSTPIIL